MNTSARFSRLSTFLLFLLLAGCTPDIPEGVNPMSEPLLPWRYPDTVKVDLTSVEIHDEESLRRSVRSESVIPDPDLETVQRKWLEKNDYARINTRLDTTYTGKRGEIPFVGARYVLIYVRVH